VRDEDDDPGRVGLYRWFTGRKTTKWHAYSHHEVPGRTVFLCGLSTTAQSRNLETRVEEAPNVPLGGHDLCAGCELELMKRWAALLKP
jgi:hypothetical protein